jgi:GTP cyclohydrolase I
MGVETPMVSSDVTLDDKHTQMAFHFSKIMELLQLDLSDDSLHETPRRVAKMYLKEVFGGLDYRNFPKVTTIDNKMTYDSMLVERHIRVNSMCEHHFVPIIGEAFVAYIPDKKVIGLSKINRVVEFFCRRPQVQERLVEQIYEALTLILDTPNVAVVIKATHLCVRLRGVEDSNSDTITSKLGGAFFSGNLRNEFLQSINL